MHGIVFNVELEPIDIIRQRDLAGNPQSRLIRIEDISQDDGRTNQAVRIDPIGIQRLGRFTHQRRMRGLTNDLNPVGGVANVRVTDRRAREFVGFTKTNLQLVCAFGQAAIELIEIGTAAADADIISVRGVGRSGQDDTHPGILRIGRVSIGFAESRLPQRLNVVGGHRGRTK